MSHEYSSCVGVSHAITDYSIAVFKHLHNLNLKFHLGRETGKITTAIDSSQLAIGMVITNVLFRITPVAVGVVFAFIIAHRLSTITYADTQPHRRAGYP